MRPETFEIETRKMGLETSLETPPEFSSVNFAVSGKSTAGGILPLAEPEC